MPDTKREIYTFTIGGKKSPVYYVPDKYLIFFNRLGLIDSVKYQKPEEFMTLKKQEGGFGYINPAKLGAVDLVELHMYIKRPVRDGYLYVIEDKASPLVSEYEIFGGTLIPILENRKPASITEDVRQEMPNYDEFKFVYVSKENKTLFAYSPVQWSAGYLKDCVSDKNNLRKRFQVFDPTIRHYLDSDPARIHESIQIACPIPTAEEQEKFDKRDSEFMQTPRFRELMALYNLSIDYKLMSKSEYKKLFYHFTLHDPIGCANDLCESLDNQYRYHQALIGGLPIGKSPQDMLLSNNTVDSESEDNIQCYSLYTASDIVYRMTRGAWARKRENKTTNDILKKILGIKERGESFNKIVGFRSDLGSFMRINYYQNALLDIYYNKNTSSLIDGQNICMRHIQCLNIKPSVVDPQSVSLKDNEYDEFIRKSYFYEEGESPLQQPGWLENGQEVQYVCREVLNTVHSDYIRKVLGDKKKDAKSKQAGEVPRPGDLKDDRSILDKAEPKVILADKIASLLDTFFGVYIYSIEKDIHRIQIAQTANRYLSANATDAALEWSKKELDILLNEYKINPNNQRDLQKFMRKALGLNKGQTATQEQQKTIKRWIDQMYKKSEFVKKVLRPNDGRTKLGKMQNTVRRAIEEEVNAATRTRIITGTEPYTRMNLALDDQVALLREDRVYSIIKKTWAWNGIVTLFSTANIFFATRRLIKEKKLVSLVNSVGALMELTAASISVYAAVTKMDAAQIGKRSLIRLGARNLNFGLAARLSILSGVVGGIVSVWDGITEIQKGNEATGIAYIASGGFALGAAVAFWGAYAGWLGAFAWSGPLAILAVLAFVVGMAMSQTEFENYLSNSVYKKVRIAGLSNMPPHEALQHFYKQAIESKDWNFEADNEQVYNLKDFRQMLGWLYEKLYSIDFDEKMEYYGEYHTATPILFCPRFALTCKLPALPPNARLEYCMQIEQNDMDEIHNGMRDNRYRPDQKTTKIIHVLPPEKPPVFEKVHQDGKLKGYTAKFSFDVSSILQEYINKQLEIPGYYTRTDSRKRMFARKKYELNFYFAVRVLLDDIGQYTWPISIDKVPQHYVLKGRLYNNIQHMNQKFSAFPKKEFMLATDLLIKPVEGIMKEIDIEIEELKSELNISQDEQN
ncbi:MAG: toxin VasX [Dysgonomonas sp.]|nr:toxin VasX [Dysgonomonas sp.]